MNLELYAVSFEPVCRGAQIVDVSVFKLLIFRDERQSFDYFYSGNSE